MLLKSFITSNYFSKVMDQQAKHGDTIVFVYKGTLDDGKVFDFRSPDQPAVVVLGQHQVFPSLELAIEGMHPGESKNVRLEPADAYGEYDKTLVTTFPASKIPPGAQPGQILDMQKDDGSKMLAKVVEIQEDKVVIDLNHPLAGQPLNFDVQLLAINPETPSTQSQDTS